MSQPDLKTLQSRFMDFVYGSGEDPSDFVLDSDSQSAAERLAVYRGSVLGNLTLALGDIFPVTKNLLGEQFFDAMALRYINAHPSKASSLDHYGADMPTFATNFKPLNDYPYIPDVLRFEWEWHTVFHEKEQGLMDFARLGQLDPETQLNIIFELKQALRVFESTYPILKIWQSHHPTLSFDDIDENIDLDEPGGAVLIWRDGLEMRTDPLSPAGQAFLELVQQKIKFGTICEQWGSKYPNDDIGQISGLAAQQGWIADFEV